MIFKCEKKELQTATANVSRAAAVKSPVPAMEGILLETDGGKLKLTAYDGKIGIYTRIEAEISEDGAIVIPARFLVDLVRKLPEGEVTVKADRNCTCEISCGKTEVSNDAVITSGELAVCQVICVKSCAALICVQTKLCSRKSADLLLVVEFNQFCNIVAFFINRDLDDFRCLLFLITQKLCADRECIGIGFVLDRALLFAGAVGISDSYIVLFLVDIKFGIACQCALVINCHINRSRVCSQKLIIKGNCESGCSHIKNLIICTFDSRAG